MRKSLMVPVGLVSAAVLTVAGIAAANAATASPSEPPATGAAPATTAAGATTAIGQADAEQAALAAVPGGSVLETRLQSRGGRLVWNVHLSTPEGVVEVKVDAQTGAASLDEDGAAATVPDDDQADDHGGDRGDNRGGGGSGRDSGHRDGHGTDDPAGHH
jgi:uncharacterized membrane protein YkoI